MSQKGCERKENDEQMQNMLYSIFCGGGRIIKNFTFATSGGRSGLDKVRTPSRRKQ